MDKIERKSKVVVRVEFLDSPMHQKILGQYLKNSGEPKALVMSTVSSRFLAMALSDYGNVSMQELERIGRSCRREMLHHVSDLDDFFALKYQINLRGDRLVSENIKNIPLPLLTNEDEDKDLKKEDGEDDYDNFSDDEYLAMMNDRIVNSVVKNN